MNGTDDFDYKKYLLLVSKKKYLFVILALVIMAGVVVTSYLLPERYVAKCTVFIEKSVIGELVKGIAISPSSEDNLKVLAYTMTSRNLLLKVFNDLGFDFNKLGDGQQEKMVRNFQGRTDIKLKDSEGLFIVSFSDKDPRAARDFVNALVRRYVVENSASKREESNVASKFLGEQIATIKAKLDAVESRTNSYKQDRGSVLAQNEGAVLAEIGEAQQKLNDLAIQRRQLENMQSLAKRNDPLQTKLVGLQKKLQELGLVYTDNHPEIIGTKNEIASVKEQMKMGSAKDDLAAVTALEVEKIALELNAVREAENNQKRLIGSRQSLLRNIPAVKSGLDELEREKNSQKNLYEQLVARYGQSEVSKQMEVQDKATTFRIVDPAILPTRPFSPQRVKIILLGIVGGLLASFGFLVLLDHLDTSVRNVDSLKSLGIPVLAVVPTIDNPAELQALRRRDFWFYAIAGFCFMLILGTVPLELLRDLSIDVFNPADIKPYVTNVTLR